MKSFIQRGSLSSNVTSFLGTNLEKMFIIVSLKIETCLSVLTVLLLGGKNLQSQILKRGHQNKISAWGILKSPCHRYFPGGGLLYFCQKGLCKMKYGF